MELNPQMGNTSQTDETTSSSINTPNSVSIITPIESNGNESQILGLTEEEIKDPNEITVTIADQKNPIIVLFGPPSCGKTMTLIRLTRYLRTKGFKVEPIANFRPSTDKHYKKMCDEFPLMINNNDAAESTKNISFMLVRVLNSVGKVLCQILEAPGEYYYNPLNKNEPEVNFPSYVNVIKNSKNRKIWCYMVEPEWKYSDQNPKYVEKIHKLKKDMRPADKAIFIFNKIDLTSFVISPGQVNRGSAKKEIEDSYPGIFTPFRSSGIFGMYDKFELVPFQTGSYSSKIKGGYSFQEGPYEYPQKLWNTILKYIRG